MDFARFLVYMEHVNMSSVIASLLLFSIGYSLKKFIDYLWKPTNKVNNEVIVPSNNSLLPIDNPILYLWDFNMQTCIDNINFQCPFRDKLFKKMLKIRTQITLTKLKEAFVNHDFNQMNKDELLKFWIHYFNEMKQEWNMYYYKDDIPKIIIEKFEQANAEVYSQMFSDLKNIIQQDNIYIDNHAKLCSITDLFYTENYHSFSKTMLLHQKLNGDLIGKTVHEHHCPCDEYKRTGQCRIGLVTSEVLKEKSISTD